jgi:hypothetical protein
MSPEIPKSQDYTVDRIEETRRISPHGEVLTYYRIWATSKKGTLFHIEVAENEMEKAPGQLQKRAQMLDSLKG